MITECLLHNVLTRKSSSFLILVQNTNHLNQGLLQKLEGFMYLITKFASKLSRKVNADLALGRGQCMISEVGSWSHDEVPYFVYTCLLCKNANKVRRTAGHFPL